MMIVLFAWISVLIQTIDSNNLVSLKDLLSPAICLLQLVFCAVHDSQFSNITGPFIQYLDYFVFGFHAMDFSVSRTNGVGEKLTENYCKSM
jgi:hypothetical protein